MSLDARRRTRRRARAPTARPAHAQRGRRRSVGSTTRSRLGARSASPVSALREPSRRCDEESSSSQQAASSSSKQQAASSEQQQPAASSSSKQQQAAAARSRNDLLAARRALSVVVSARVSWRGDRQSSNKAERDDVGRRSEERPERRTLRTMARLARVRRGRRRDQGTAYSRLGAALATIVVLARVSNTARASRSAAILGGRSRAPFRGRRSKIHSRRRRQRRDGDLTAAALDAKTRPE